MYNFTKTSHDANRREFKQPLFRKGKRNLLPLISRKTQKAIRSIDSALDNIDANDLFVVATSQSEMLEGRPLIRCKSIDSSSYHHSVPEGESSPLWQVVQELQMRVHALEGRLHQVSRGEMRLFDEEANKNTHHLDSHTTHLSNVDTSNSSSSHCHSTRHTINTTNNSIATTSNKQHGCNSPLFLKKIRANSDKSVSSSSSSSEGEENGQFDGKLRARSMSFSSYESSYSFESSSSSGSSSSGSGSGMESGGPPPRAKRGVDAILSAAEILHDGLPARVVCAEQVCYTLNHIWHITTHT
jgi:hypothetical protein